MKINLILLIALPVNILFSVSPDEEFSLQHPLHIRGQGLGPAAPLKSGQTEKKEPKDRSEFPAKIRFSDPNFVQNATYVRFNVAKVPELSHPGKTISVDQYLYTKFGPTLAKSENLKSFFDTPEDNGTFVSSNFINPFVLAGEYAFRNHRPLVLSPDQIWQLVLQGLNIHINQNPRRYKELLVSHSNKMRLRALYDEQKEINWSGIIEDFGSQIRKKSRKSINDLMSVSFSTSGAHHQIARTITFMEILKEHYEYETYPICGIPYFVLRGTPADWAKLQQSISLLANYDLDWWLSELTPILTKIADAANGKIDQVFWDDFITERSGYGISYLNGWFNAFFPYVIIEEYRQNPKSPGMSIAAKTTKFKRNAFKEKHQLAAYPTGLSTVTVKHHFSQKDGIKNKNLELISGFLGMTETQNRELFAEIGWLVRDPAKPINFLRKTTDGTENN